MQCQAVAVRPIAAVRPPPGLEALGPAPLVQRWSASSAEVTDLLLKVMSKFAAPPVPSPRGSALAPPPGLGGVVLAPPPCMDTRYKAMVVASGDLASTNDTSTRDFFDVMSDTDEEGCKGPMTTLMVRNIPTEYTEEMLMEEWTLDMGYDFLYLPRNNKGKANLGYAFVNFVSEAHAEAFRVRFQKNRLAHFEAAKRLNISLAEVQGLDANVRQLKQKPAARMKARHCQPIIVRDGQKFGLDEL